MFCTVIDIRGDYAFLRYEDTGVVSEVAIALLPLGVDVGDRLKFEDYEFSRAERNPLTLLGQRISFAYFFF